MVQCGRETKWSKRKDLEQSKNLEYEAGTYSVILDSDGGAVCVIETTEVYSIPFCEVSAVHAYKEGESSSLEYWRKVHKVFSKECLEGTGILFDEDMEVV